MNNAAPTLTGPQRLYFRNLLREARFKAMNDAEAYLDVLTAIENLGNICLLACCRVWPSTTFQVTWNPFEGLPRLWARTASMTRSRKPGCVWVRTERT